MRAFSRLLFNVCQQDCLAKHFLNLVEIHADTFENFHRLTAKETMSDAINLRKRPFTQEAFDFEGFTDYLAVIKQAHNVFGTSG